MILDGYWKRDLMKIKQQLKFWSSRGGSIMHDYAEHRINRCLLFSAAIIRKIVDDEADAKKIMKKDNFPMAPFKILHCTVPMKAYKHTNEEKFFLVSKLILSDYDVKQGVLVNMTLKDVCNQIIHSYVWSTVHYGKKDKLIYGVMFASDLAKEKYVYLLRIEDWITALDFVIENCNIQSKESLI